MEPGITVERLFSPQCSGNQFRHDELMRERYADYVRNANAESQVTVTSANSVPCPSPAPDRDTTSSQSQLSAMPNTDGQSQSVSHTAEPAVPEAQSQYSEGDEPMTESGDLDGLDPTSLYSQDSSVSDLALDARFAAFQAILENARDRTGWEIGLLSTTDNHARMDEDLTYKGLH